MSTVNSTINKIGYTIESLFGGKPKPQQPISNSNGGKQTCLERFGIEARGYHLLRNEWRKDLEYSKPLVDAEYMIQNEFPVGTTDSDVATQAQEAAENKAREAEKAAKKEAKKKAKEEKKLKKEAEKQKPINDRKGPKEITDSTVAYMNQLGKESGLNMANTRWG
jgi:hypothetical protein